MLEERKDGLYDVNDVGVESILEDYEDGYYHVFEDVYKYPEANVLVAYSRRGPGKTTGALLGCIHRGLVVCYMKRTIADVKMIIGGGLDGADLSPWATVNRILDSDIQYKAIAVKGVEGFAEVRAFDLEGNVIDQPPVGYICALSAAGKIKGFDLSVVSVMIVDEFVPNKGVIARSSEGDNVLDVLSTLSRDRHLRNLPPIKLMLFSNCDYLSCPISRTLGLLDDIYELSCTDEPYHYNKERGMLIHHITKGEFKTTTQTTFDWLKGTQWFVRNIDGNFDMDTSMIYKPQSIKNYKAIATIKYDNKTAYVLYRESDSSYYITYTYNSRVGNDIIKFNLALESDTRLFGTSALYSNILEASMLSKVAFERYTLYDLIKNYFSIFRDSIY